MPDLSNYSEDLAAWVRENYANPDLSHFEFRVAAFAIASKPGEREKVEEVFSNLFGHAAGEAMRSA